MKVYIIEFKWMKPYPKEQVIRMEAGSMPTATGRAMRCWKKENGRGVKKVSVAVTEL